MHVYLLFEKDMNKLINSKFDIPLVSINFQCFDLLDSCIWRHTASESNRFDVTIKTELAKARR